MNAAGAAPTASDRTEYVNLWEAITHDDRVMLTDAPTATLLRRAVEYRKQAQNLVKSLALDMRNEGATWKQIGQALGVSLQAAQQLCLRPVS